MSERFNSIIDIINYHNETVEMDSIYDRIKSRVPHIEELNKNIWLISPELIELKGL